MKQDIAPLPMNLGPADLELVLALARGRTLAGAAERLRVDTSTVFRGIKRIERNLGERLFERGRNGYLPTDLGADLAAHAERIETALQQARERAFRSAPEPSGTLRVTTTDTILHSLLLPLLKRFSEHYPAVNLELIASNTVANLSQRDADIAIRATRTPPEHLVGVKLGGLPAGVFAARSYLAGRAQPLDLATADWIALDESLPDHPSVRWRKTRLPQIAPRYRCNSVLSVAGAVAHGLGVGVVPLFVLGQHPEVKLVAGPLAELETDLWVLAHPDVRHLQRVKLLFDFLKAEVRL
ncbi:LysR family transcriptional regulator [Massilia arenosa]|uniref:LysR family transcriptional regulator n=1 Tax=Zemynaea arenosa TaxID=2561931 RepID=A0A4Y9SA48_9BURK|nr:LysR family transcriptional regulator [Massilia arenosa]TFW17409.1 LysR family transcriptional regulator [Massilia arenosa]